MYKHTVMPFISNDQVWPLVSGSRVCEEPRGLQVASGGGHHLTDGEFQFHNPPMRSPADLHASGYCIAHELSTNTGTLI